jgi:hypothetical protein
MRRSLSWSAGFALVVAVVLLLRGVHWTYADEGAGRWTRGRVQSSTPAEWAVGLEAISTEEVQVAEGLAAVALDIKADAAKRIEAAVSLASVSNERAAGLCFEHVSVRVPGGEWLRDEDRLKDKPFRYALSRMGWRMMQGLGGWDSTVRTEEEVSDVAWALVRALGKSLAKALVMRLAEESQGATGSNLGRVLAAIGP